MCGLVAAFMHDGAEAAVRSALLRLRNRGPDGEGLWQDEHACLGHRRLAVIDLDERAAQPMQSACGRYVIVFNGEIYNYAELRQSLLERGTSMRTTSDTEVLLALFALEGEAMLPRLKGMFALVIWDRTERRAFIARDPYGIKPLYVATTGDGVLVGSQVKALLATGRVSREPDAHGQAGFWMLGSVPEPATWFRDVRALPAGHCAWIEAGRAGPTRAWFDIGDAWRSADAAPREVDDLRERVRAALVESIRRHLVADVPVGVFLSGGIDSGALAGLMIDAGARGLQGVTITYDEFAGQAQDEGPPAARIAAHYGIAHHVRRVTRSEFLADLPRILDAMDQPSVDGVNTWFASKAVAEQGLKVVVSGVGGDELFQGYSSFKTLPRLVAAWRAIARVPGARALAGTVANAQARRSGNDRWGHATAWAQSIGGAWWLRRSLNAPEALPELMGAELAAEALRGFDPSRWVASMSGALPADDRLALGLIESTTYLRNQLLRDSDWASMDHGVELRTPLVDAQLTSTLGALLPAFSRHPDKVLLAEAPSRPLPPEVAARPKTGFSVPMAQWLRSDAGGARGSGSRDWAMRVAASYETGVGR